MDNFQQTVTTCLHDEHIIEIRLNRPTQLNALNHEVLQQLFHILKEIKHNRSIQGVLLSGEGKAFCAGADITELEALTGVTGLTFSKFGQAVFREFELLGKPTVAAIQGYAFGGGCELAMAATIRIAAENTQFGQPEIKLGVIPGFGGTQRLPRLVGKGRAMELCLTGRRFSAKEALDWGFITEITPLDELIPRAKAILNQLIQFSSNTIDSIMTVIDQGYDLPADAAFSLEAAHFGICCTTADKNEGIQAFLEKRAAVFSGE